MEGLRLLAAHLNRFVTDWLTAGLAKYTRGKFIYSWYYQIHMLMSLDTIPASAVSTDQPRVLALMTIVVDVSPENVDNSLFVHYND